MEKTNTEEVVAELPDSGTAMTVQEDEMMKDVASLKEQAGTLVISSDEDYAKAADFARTIKQQSAKVTEFFAPMKKAAHDAHKNICDREKEMLAPLVAMEKAIKNSMSEYVMEQERRRAEEEERLRRLAREEAEKRLGDAIALDEAGKSEESAAALEEASMVDEASRSLIVEGQKPQADGTSVSYSYELTSVDSSKVPVNFVGVCLRPVDEKLVLRLIKETNGQVQIPGVTFRKVANISIRK